jgi:DNA-binding FadR family transcriptional regulator
MPLQNMDRSSLASRVTAQLQSLIESGEWPVGTKIPAEPVLVQVLGVGRNTVREAVRALVHSGMLEPRQGDGTYVLADNELGAALLRRVRHTGHLEALEVRNSLERDAARLAAARRTEQDVAALRAALRNCDSARDAGDDEAFVHADVAFHQAVVAAAHNSMLADLYGHLVEGLRATVNAVTRGPLPAEQRTQREAHTALVDAIEVSDPEAAQRCVGRYIDESTRSVHTLDEDPLPAGRPRT